MLAIRVVYVCDGDFGVGLATAVAALAPLLSMLRGRIFFSRNGAAVQQLASKSISEVMSEPEGNRLAQVRG